MLANYATGMLQDLRKSQVSCVAGVLGLVALLSRGKTFFNWRKDEKHEVTDGRYNRTGGGDSTSGDSPNVVDFRTDVDLKNRRRKNGG